MCKFLKHTGVIILVVGMFALGWIMADNEQMREDIASQINNFKLRIDLDDSVKAYISESLDRMLDVNGFAKRLFDNANEIMKFAIELFEKNISYLQNNILLLQ